ncbi:hypothetical protein ACLOJK_030087 [Asimina triloba]
MSKISGFISILQGCNSMERLRKIHAQILVNGYRYDPSVSLKLLNFCAVSVVGDLTYARVLFDEMASPQTAAWNSIIRGYSQSSFPVEAIFLYNRMMEEGQSAPDTFTFSFLLKACERVKAKKKCREVHGSIIQGGFASDVMVSTNLLRCYAGNNEIEIARRAFNEMPEKDMVAWNSMISCYSQAGLHDDALRIYDQIKILDLGLDAFTVVGLLSSCAHLGALNFGIKMHKLADENGLLDNMFVGNALIDMYAKCGCLDAALQVFEGMKRRDVLTWNSVIVGLGVNGHGDEAISFFKRMLAVGLRPSSVTFLGLLRGCSHQGLVEDGVKYFHMMNSQFNLKPGVKHYGCMVDLFGRAGRLHCALEMIRDSASHDDPVLWRTLLSACKIHRNVEMGEEAMRNLVQINASNAGDCILLSRIYDEVGDRQGVMRMRKIIKCEGIKTTPGWTWIEVDGIVHRFVAGDKSHENYEEIHLKLKEMIRQATLMGYVKEKYGLTEPESFEQCSNDEDQCHSEKLAIAFGYDGFSVCNIINQETGVQQKNASNICLQVLRVDSTLPSSSQKRNCKSVVLKWLTAAEFDFRLVALENVPLFTE